jgi:branched-chain amino acid transport system substrate-binding protein
MTGPYAIFGQQMQHGVQTAVDDINAAGGVDDDILSMQVEDDGCDNRGAEIAARNLISKQVDVVIGHFCSNPALAAARLYETSGIPMIAPSPSLPKLTESGLWNVVRLASRDDVQGDVAAARIAADFPTGVVAVLNDGNAGHVALANRFTAHLGKAPALVLSFKPDAADFSDLINEIKSRQINVIYFACEASDAGRIVAGLKLADVKAALFGADSLLIDLYWEKARAAGENTHVTFASDPQAAHDTKSAMARLRAAGFDSSGATLPSYAAVQLFAAAAQKTDAKNGRAIADYLRSGKPIPTAIGSLSFDTKGDVQLPRFVWYKWSNGKYAAESPAN